MRWLKQHVLFIAWAQAVVAMLGSLYFSEIMDLTPCVLCWYQRIAVYPLVIIIAVGILKQERWIHWYVLPMSVVGLGISIYHNLLYWKILPESAAPCELGVSCTTRYVEWFGFVTIPFLSMVAFAIITLCMIIFMKSRKTV